VFHADAIAYAVATAAATAAAAAASATTTAAAVAASGTCAVVGRQALARQVRCKLSYCATILLLLLLCHYCCSCCTSCTIVIIAATNCCSHTSEALTHTLLYAMCDTHTHCTTMPQLFVSHSKL
jgi:hypothetical protein